MHNRNSTLPEIGTDVLWTGQEVADFAAAPETDIFSMRGQDRITFIVKKPAGGGALQIDLKQHTSYDPAAAGYAVKPLTFKRAWYKSAANLQDEAALNNADRPLDWKIVENFEVTQLDTAALPNGTATGFPAGDEMFMIEAIGEDMDVDNDFNFVSLCVTAGAGAGVISAVSSGRCYPRLLPDSSVV